jgi:hypothetical protein
VCHSISTHAAPVVATNTQRLQPHHRVPLIGITVCYALGIIPMKHSLQASFCWGQPLGSVTILWQCRLAHHGSIAAFSESATMCRTAYASLRRQSSGAAPTANPCARRTWCSSSGRWQFSRPPTKATRGRCCQHCTSAKAAFTRVYPLSAEFGYVAANDVLLWPGRLITLQNVLFEHVHH